MFGVNSINGSVQWLVISAPLRTNGPPWTDNILAPSPACGTCGTDTNTNWCSQHGGPSGTISVLWSGPVRAMPAYICRSPENTRSASHRVCDDLLRENCMARIQSISIFRSIFRNCRG